LIWLSAFVLATLTGVVSAWLPAYRASRLDPVEAIRG
jgi:lipoprotein-releasing system permease protein